MGNVDLYKVFYTVAKCGSITKAAEELYLSQPAISYAIKQLEKQVGGKLFNRVSRGMELTEVEGRKIFEIVSEFLSKLSKAESELSAIKSVANGSIKISASDTFVTHYLMKYVVEYHENYPNVNLSFINSSSKQSLELVKTNKADIGFVNIPFEEKGVLFTGQTGTLHDVFAANNNFSHLFKRELNLTAMANYPLLMLDSTTSTRSEIDRFTNDLGIKLTPEYELSSVELMVEMSKRGMGIACVPREYIKEELSAGTLTELNVSPAFPARMTSVAVNKDKVYSFALSEFLKLLNKYEKTE